MSPARAGDPMWAEAQHRVLHFRQAIANSDDTRVRIDDSAEARAPRFYLRQLLGDFEVTDVREAWQLKARTCRLALSSSPGRPSVT